MEEDDVTSSTPMDSAEALKVYGDHFGEQKYVTDMLGSFPWSRNKCSAKLDHERQDGKAREEFQRELDAAEQKHVLKGLSTLTSCSIDGDAPNDYAEDSDGEQLQLCHQCRLPLGAECCHIKEKCVHVECAEEDTVREMQMRVERRANMEMEQKHKNHIDYGIVWNIESIPRNDAIAKNIVMRDVPQGMVCIVLHEEFNQIELASTLSPSAALNLEYLSTALKVRRLEGREPMFSLDPASPDLDAMQAKRFVPDWLAGTSAGDVLFQADYHLKELSMGLYDQPVVGMKCCFHHNESQDWDKSWRSRLWFSVRKAEVHMSEQSVLTPFVKMGVEAREVVIQDGRSVDKQVTRPEHPMVLYGDEFTQNFDLIAERKSVIYHLRELAKAAVIAKYLLDPMSNVEVDDFWFDLSHHLDVPCSLEVPQLWNRHIYGQIDLASTDPDSLDVENCLHGIYGGVQFGLDKFSLSPSGSRVHQASVIGNPRQAIAGLSSFNTMDGGQATLGSFSVPVAGGLSGVSRHPAASIGTISRPGAAVGMSVAGLQAAMASISRPVAAGIGASVRHSSLSLTASGQMATIATMSRPVAASMSAAMKNRESAHRFMPGAVSRASAPPRMVNTMFQESKFPSIPAVPRSVSAARASLQESTPPSLPSAPRSVSAAPASLQESTPPSLPSVPRSVAAARALIARLGEKTDKEGPHAMAATIAAVGAGRSRMQGRLPVSAAAFGKNATKLQGVDLRLDDFDLSEAKLVSSEVQQGSWSGDVKSLDECISMGATFWSCLEKDSAIFREDDRSLLNDIFNAKLSDRRLEGDLFCPPDASHTYVAKLRALVKQEQVVRQRRKDFFFNPDFVMEDWNPLFPLSWKSVFEHTDHQNRPRAMLVARPDYKDRAAELLQNALESRTPIFDKMTEEGMRFRIHSFGNLQIHSSQELGKEEVVGAVFSTHRPRIAAGPSMEAHDSDKIIDATLYVEQSWGSRGSTHRYFVVLGTEAGRKIRTERVIMAKDTWETEPADLDDRNGLAKVLLRGKCSPSLCVGDLKTYSRLHLIQKSAQDKDVTVEAAPDSVCKRHAQKLFARVTGVSARRPYQSKTAHRRPIDVEIEALTKWVACQKRMACAQKKV